MFYFVLFEVLVIIACIFGAKKMVEKRNRFTKFISIGTDDEQTIEKMKSVVMEIARTGKFEMSNELDGYEVELKAKENCVGEVVIKSPVTKVSYHFIDGMRIENLAYTENGAVAYIAFCLWCCTLFAQIFVGIIALVVWVRAMLT